MSIASAGETRRRATFGLGLILRLGVVYLGLIVVDAFALFLIYAFALDGVWELAITVALITLMVNVIYLRRGLYAQRWIAPALALMCLMVVFPMVYTVYVSFTNYGDGNLLTKQQVINLLARDTYLPEGGQVFGWDLYQNDAGELALWLTDESDGDAYYFATLGRICAGYGRCGRCGIAGASIRAIAN